MEDEMQFKNLSVCSACHRVLKNPKSIAIGIGPVCLRRVQAKIAANSKRKGQEHESEKHS